MIKGTRVSLDGALAASQANSRKPLGEEEILAEFDRLVDTGVVKYDYAYVIENHKINGVDASSYGYLPPMCAWR